MNSHEMQKLGNGRREWLLKGEGRCSCVVWVRCSDGDVPCGSYVLRLSKKPVWPRKCRAVCRALVGFVEDDSPVFQLSSALLLEIEAAVPQVRQILQPVSGCFLRDATLLVPPSLPSSRQQWAAELKLKRGCLPAVHAVSFNGTTFGVPQSKMRQCVFSMMQSLKQSKHEEEGMQFHRSLYCPLDIFSNDEARVRHAVACLLVNPQNNFKGFIDGVPVTVDQLMMVVPRTTLVDSLTNVLLESSVLNAIHSLQQCALDVSLLAPIVDLWNAKKKMPDEMHELILHRNAQRHDLCRAHNSVFIDENSTRKSESKCLKVTTMQMNQWLDDQLQCFFAATTASDCSVVVCFAPFPMKECRINSDASSFASRMREIDSRSVRLTVLDVDCKEYKGLHFYWHQQAELLAAPERRPQ